MDWIPTALSLVGLAVFLVGVWVKDYQRGRNYLLMAIYLELSVSVVYLSRIAGS